jgi:hypothetical protein
MTDERHLRVIRETFGEGEDDGAQPPTTPPDPPTYELLVEFTAHCKGYRGSDSNGEVVLNVAVPLEQKYQALPWTDIPGEMVLVTVQRRVRRRREAPDGG